jgi:hypothetical protein
VAGSIRFIDKIHSFYRIEPATLQAQPLSYHVPPKQCIASTNFTVVHVKILFLFKSVSMISSTSGGRSVGIVRSRTKGHGVCLFVCLFCVSMK